MALPFILRRARWAMLMVALGIVLTVFLVRGCRGGQRLTGEAAGQVQSFEEVPVEHILELPELDEHLFLAEPPMTPGDFINLSCAQIVDDEIEHLVYTKDANCFSVVLPHALGYDMVLTYTDAECQYPPTFEALRTEDQLHFNIYKGIDRGNCDDARVFAARGIRLANQPGGTG